MIDENTTYQTIVDSTDATNVYHGFAELGRATSAPYWKIYKVNTTGDVVTTSYPIGTARNPDDGFNFKWDERDHYNYSLIPDAVAPTLSTVTIASDNTTTTLAKVGDEITLTIVSSEALREPTVTISTQTATIVAGVDDLHWTATYVMATGDTEGVIPFTIDFLDIGGIPGVQVDTVTGGASVTFDSTEPIATLQYSIDGGSNYFDTLDVKDSDTLTIQATLSEAIEDSPIIKIAIDNAVLSATNMTKVDTTHYTYALNVPAGDITNATCSMSLGVDPTGNVVEATPVNPTFTIDNTAPTMSSAVYDTDTQITLTLSELALDTTITHANDGGFVVTETGGATTYTVSDITPGATDDLVILTLADMSGSITPGVTVTYATGGNGDVSDLAGNVMVTDATGVIIPTWA